MGGLVIQQSRTVLEPLKQQQVLNRLQLPIASTLAGGITRRMSCAPGMEGPISL